MGKAVKKRPSVPGVVVYPRGKKWAYRIEVGRDPLTEKRLLEYKAGFEEEEDAWKAAIKAKADSEKGQRVAPS